MPKAQGWHNFVMDLFSPYWVVIHDGSLKGDATRHVAKDAAVNDQKFIVDTLARGERADCNLFIVGYVGWAAEQLGSELCSCDWVTAPLRPEYRLRQRSWHKMEAGYIKCKRAIGSHFRNL